MEAARLRTLVPQRVLSKLALLLLTLAPIAYMAGFLIFWISFLLPLRATTWLDSDEFPIALFAVHCAVALFSMALAGWYIFAAVNNPRLDSTMKIIWVLVLLQFNVFAMPIYWYIYIWRQPPTQPASAIPTSV